MYRAALAGTGASFKNDATRGRRVSILKFGCYVFAGIFWLPTAAFASDYPDCQNNTIVLPGDEGPETWACIVSANDAGQSISDYETDQKSKPSVWSAQMLSVDVGGQQKVVHRPDNQSAQIDKDISQILRKETDGLLKRRNMQLSIGMRYSSTRRDQSLRDERSRSATFPIDFSMGLTDKTELSVSLPLVYLDRQLVSSTDVDSTEDYGIGDMSLSLSSRIRSESESRPNVTLNFAVGTPTGKNRNPYDLNNLSLGSGFWSAATGATLSKSFDPATMFFSLRYQRIFADKQFGLTIEPGDSVEYGYGVGLSLNNKLSISGRINGSIQSDTKVNGQVLAGSNSEPLSFITTSSLQLSRKSRLESSLSMGLNNDSDDARFGMTYIKDL